MRLLHFIVMILSVLLLASVAEARPHHNHKQKRASFCMLKLCSYVPYPHKVQRLR